MLRLQTRETLAIGHLITLSASMLQHLHVRRITHHPFVLFNDINGAFRAHKTATNQAVIEQKIAEPWATPTQKLFFPIIKKKPMAFLYAKATEMGVTEFQPIITQHTQITSMNTLAMEKVCIEAIEQCERYTIPKIHDPISFDQALNNLQCPTLVPIERHTTCSTPQPLADSIMIGPEGGFSHEEKARIQNHPLCHAISFGAAILRSETAALFGIALMINARSNAHTF